MKIVFCLDYYYPHIGGAEVLFTGLAEGLVRQGHEVHVVTQHLRGVPDREDVRGVKVVRVRSLGSRYVFLLSALPALLSLARGADVLHASTFGAAVPGWLASRLTGTPLVLTVHELWIGKWKAVSDDPRVVNVFHELCERMLYWLDYRNYIAVSEATKSDMVRAGIPPSRITMIYNGIDYSFWDAGQHRPAPRSGSGGEYVFFFSGRPGVSKGLTYLLWALREVVHLRPQVRLKAIVGRSGSARKGYENACELIRKLGLSQVVELVAPVDAGQLPSQVLSADAVVIPSLSEGFGYAAAEACALGMPVIGTDNASLPEVISGRRLLVPPRNAKALAAAMVDAVDGKWEETPMRVFPQDVMIRKHLELYEKLANNGEDR